MDSVKVVRDLIFSAVLKAIMGRLVVAIPFLGLPIIGPLASLVIGKILSIAFDELQLIVEFKLIAADVAGQKEDYDKAVSDLKVVLDKPKELQDAAEIEKAKEALKAKLRELVNFKPN